MVIVSAKVSKRKLLMGLAAAVCVVALLVILLAQSAQPPEAAPVQTLSGSTNDERVAFLEGFGWQVEQTPTETQEVRIPEEFNEVFTRYNRLQQEQGFDLASYAGKAAKRYVYAVTDDTGNAWSATVLVHRGKVIGGDVSSDQGGMHGFQKA